MLVVEVHSPLDILGAAVIAVMSYVFVQLLDRCFFPHYILSFKLTGFVPLCSPKSSCNIKLVNERKSHTTGWIRLGFETQCLYFLSHVGLGEYISPSDTQVLTLQKENLGVCFVRIWEDERGNCDGVPKAISW